MRTVRTTWPFDVRLSKSVAKGSSRHKGRKTVIRRSEHREARDELATHIASLEGPWYKAHLTVYLLVVMPRFFTDAVNFVDAVADAIRDGTGIDDKWFKFTVDWAIDASNPRLEITVAQAAHENHAWCPKCSQMLPETMFYYAKSQRTSECRECFKAKQRQKRAIAS